MAIIDHNANPDWKDAASRVIRSYPPGHVFLGEDVRDALDAQGVTVHDRRALGPVIRREATAGVIENIGFAAARTSNLSPKVLWRRR
jgi:hypothetical protein